MTVPSLPYFGPRGTYFGKVLGILLKQAKIDGCKPSFQARLRKLAFYLSTIHMDSILQQSM
jgi:hypothetical protein